MTQPSWTKKPFDIIRILFGLVWAVDAAFKWTPAFLKGLVGQLSSALPGQPAPIADWLNLWIGIVGHAPHFFAILIALAESAIAIGLIFDLLPRATLGFGFAFSLLIWSVGEAFGGPYMSGSTDIGAAVIYAFVFAALWFWRYGGNEKSAVSALTDPKHTAIALKTLSAAVIILLALLVEPYFVTRTSTAQQTDMPPGMMMKTFELATGTSTAMDSMGRMNMAAHVPIPTISFTIVKDSLDGWDIHVDTTDFTWTPQLINQAPVADQGHVHLYIDGDLTVLLAPWYHIDGSVLLPGKHIITVSLNANDHSVFTDNGQNIQSTQTLVVSPI